MAAAQDSGFGNLTISDSSAPNHQEVSHIGNKITDLAISEVSTSGRISKDQQKELGTPGTSADPLSSKKTPSSSPFRFQVKLENGFFTTALKNDLIRNLYGYLYRMPPDSFLPTFDGYGLRYGKIWFSPENEKSCIWLKQTLLEINEQAANIFKFCIEPYGLKQNKICFTIPWNQEENLTINDVLHRLHFQNPLFLINLWKVISVKTNTAESRLVFCSADVDSIQLLKKHKFRIYYGFQKLLVRALPQSKSAKSKTEMS